MPEIRSCCLQIPETNIWHFTKQILHFYVKIHFQKLESQKLCQIPPSWNFQYNVTLPKKLSPKAFVIVREVLNTTSKLQEKIWPFFTDGIVRTSIHKIKHLIGMKFRNHTKAHTENSGPQLKVFKGLKAPPQSWREARKPCRWRNTRNLQVNVWRMSQSLFPLCSATLVHMMRRNPANKIGYQSTTFQVSILPSDYI